MNRGGCGGEPFSLNGAKERMTNFQNECPKVVRNGLKLAEGVQMDFT